MEWTVDWKGPGNRIEYVLDQKLIERRVFRPGAAMVSVKNTIAMEASDAWNLDIDLSRNRIEIRSDGKVLDRFERPNPDESLGKFGFEGDIELKTR